MPRFFIFWHNTLSKYEVLRQGKDRQPNSFQLINFLRQIVVPRRRTKHKPDGRTCHNSVK